MPEAGRVPTTGGPRSTTPTTAMMEAVSRRVLADAEALSALDLIADLGAHNQVSRSGHPHILRGAAA